jgi:hypothetical protein
MPMNCRSFAPVGQVTRRLLACTLVGMFATASAEATSLNFKLSDVVVQADGTQATSGSLNALLDLTGDYVAHPPNVSSLNVAFELNGHPAGVAFGAPQDPAANRLIPNGVPFAGATQLPHVVRFAKDAGAPVQAVDGALMVTVPFTLAAGITAGSFPVRFITGNELGSGNAVALPITLVDGSITVVPAGPFIMGDYNRNGLVDAADYGLWRKTMGQSGIGLAADGNGNNLVDAVDYSVWRAHFGHSAIGSALVPGIPEPATWRLLAVAIMMLLSGRHTSRRW